MSKFRRNNTAESSDAGVDLLARNIEEDQNEHKPERIRSANESNRLMSLIELDLTTSS